MFKFRWRLRDTMVKPQTMLRQISLFKAMSANGGILSIKIGKPMPDKQMGFAAPSFAGDPGAYLIGD
ncbi:MAG: hypothetical protein KBA54_01200 [Candidatus Cloacimonetes bacterium]|nr:hypothetical protein [Candidatus Cloacimonadota bacterium]